MTVKNTNRLGKGIILLSCCAMLLGLYIGFSIGYRPEPTTPAISTLTVKPPIQTQRPETATSPHHAASLHSSDTDKDLRVLNAIRNILQANTPASARQEGEGSIQGKILTEKDQPLAGVTVRITQQQRSRHRGSHHRYGTNDDRIESEIEELIKHCQEQQSLTQTTTTDEDGRYAFADLALSPHNIWASLTGYTIRAKHQSSSVVPDAEVDFTGTPVLDVECHVWLPDGSEPESATLVMKRSTHTQHKHWTPGKRTIPMEYGHYTINARSGRQQEFISATQDVTIDPTLNAPLTFQLKSGTGIKGTLAMPDDFLRASLYIYALRWKETDPPTVRKLTRKGKRAWLNRHDGGTFVFKDLSPGDYFVGVTFWNGEKIFDSEQVQVSNSMVNIALEIPALEREEYLIVWPRGPDDKLLSDISLRGSAAYLSGKHEDGSFWIIHPPKRKGHADQERTVTVQSQEYGSKSVRYTPSEQSEITVTFDDPASLNVSLSGAAESRKNSFYVAIRGKTSSHSRSSRQVQGTSPVLFQNITPGDYKIVLSSRSGFGWHAVLSKEISLLSGDNEVELELPTLYSLTVIVDDEAFGKQITLKSTGTNRMNRTLYATLGKSRHAIFGALPAGAYTLAARGGKRTGSLTVNIPEQSTVHFQLPRKNALRVVITQPQGYLAQAGLQTGDLIYAINDTEFKEIYNTHKLLTAFGAMEQMTATVLRDKNVLQIQLDSKQLKGNAGGKLEGIQVLWEE